VTPSYTFKKVRTLSGAVLMLIFLEGKIVAALDFAESEDFVKLWDGGS
jgi:hypothetical protein